MAMCLPRSEVKWNTAVAGLFFGCFNPAMVNREQLHRKLSQVFSPFRTRLQKADESGREPTYTKVSASQRPRHSSKRVRVATQEDHVADGGLERAGRQREARDGRRD